MGAMYCKSYAVRHGGAILKSQILWRISSWKLQMGVQGQSEQLVRPSSKNIKNWKVAYQYWAGIEFPSEGLGCGSMVEQVPRNH